jgi:hypothetical protein
MSGFYSLRKPLARKCSGKFTQGKFGLSSIPCLPNRLER